MHHGEKIAQQVAATTFRRDSIPRLFTTLTMGSTSLVAWSGRQTWWIVAAGVLITYQARVIVAGP